MEHMSNFLVITISVIALLSIASYSAKLAERLRFPYTILLFIVGFVLISLQKMIPGLEWMTHLELSKDLVFFLFLPTLIFESAYNMQYQKVMRDVTPITILAVVSLIVSTLFIGFVLKLALGFIGFDVPFMATMLFGAIISATDPVAVLALFKEFGVPKRLSYIFEGESILNDGTAVALFLVIVAMIESGTQISFEQIGIGTVSFLSMFIGGVLFGGFMGVLFSKLIQWVRHSSAELTLTLIMAHTTFILSELISEHAEIFKISGIIATAIAALTLGNYGRYKISHEVREMMEPIWGYFAFISNSLIFLLMGMMIGKLQLHILDLILPITLAIIIVAIGRAISIFGVIEPLNRFLASPIPRSWQTLLSWGSLRGAIAMTMLLLIPNDFSIPGWTLEISEKDFISVLVIACVVFTLVIKALTIGNFIKSMKLAELKKDEEYTYHKIRSIIDSRVLKQLDEVTKKEIVSPAVIRDLQTSFSHDQDKEKKEIKKCAFDAHDFENLLRKYGLGIERASVIELFESKQIDEKTLKRILFKIENQYIRLSDGLPQLKSEQEKASFFDNFREKTSLKIRNFTPEEIAQRDYHFFRTRFLLASRVVEHLKELKNEFEPECHQAFEFTMDRYDQWAKESHSKMVHLEKDFGEVLYKEETTLLKKHLLFVEKSLIHDMYEEHIMSSKVYALVKRSLQ